MLSVKISEERKGELYIVAETILWGLFPILSFKSLSSLGPLMSAALSQLFSIFVIMPFALRHPTMKKLQTKDAFYPVLLSTICIGVIFYALLFIAGKYEDPVTISILLLVEVPATYIVLWIFGKERINLIQALGGLFVLVSAVLALYKKELHFAPTSFLVVIAVFIAPMGNYYNKLARAHIAAPVFLLARGVLAVPFIFTLAMYFEGAPQSQNVMDSLVYIIPNGLFVFGLSKILWIEGVYRIPVGKAISLNSVFPVITMIVSYLFLDMEPSLSQSFAIIPGLLGVYLLTKK